MTYELWDVTIKRHLGEFGREEEALREVLALIEHFGEQHAANLVLISTDATGDGLTGAALASRAREVVQVHAD